MDRGLSDETWRHLRAEARRSAAAPAPPRAETAESAAAADPELLARVERQLQLLNEAWAVHERPLATRLPLIGPLLNRLAARLARFLLQNQVSFNAEVARVVQELYQVQRLLAREQIDRADDLFARQDEAVLALEARLRDLEEKVGRLRQQWGERP